MYTFGLVLLGMFLTFGAIGTLANRYLDYVLEEEDDEI